MAFGRDGELISSLKPMLSQVTKPFLWNRVLCFWVMENLKLVRPKFFVCRIRNIRREEVRFRRVRIMIVSEAKAKVLVFGRTKAGNYSHTIELCEGTGIRKYYRRHVF